MVFKSEYLGTHNYALIKAIFIAEQHSIEDTYFHFEFHQNR